MDSLRREKRNRKEKDKIRLDRDGEGIKEECGREGKRKKGHMKRTENRAIPNKKGGLKG